VPLVLIHAAAAVAVAHNLTGQIDIDTALHPLFATEDAWWQRRAAADSPELHALGLPALQAAVVLAVLLGAGDLYDAVHRLPVAGRFALPSAGEVLDGGHSPDCWAPRDAVSDAIHEMTPVLEDLDRRISSAPITAPTAQDLTNLIDQSNIKP